MTSATLKGEKTSYRYLPIEETKAGILGGYVPVNEPEEIFTRVTAKGVRIELFWEPQGRRH